MTTPQPSAPSAFGHTPFAQQVVVETTAACDQRCVFCGRTYMARPKKTMAPELFRKIADEIAAESPYAELWPTFMGEALLLGDRLFELIRYARRVGCRKITLNTNGNRLNGKTVPQLLDCGLDRLIISCDGHSKETYEQIRVGGRFERLQAGAHLLLDTRARRGLTRPLVEMQFSVFEENAHEVEAFREYWLAWGAVVKVRPKVFWSGTVTGAGLESFEAAPHPDLFVGFLAVAVTGDDEPIQAAVQVSTLKDIWNGPLKWIRELHLQRRYRELPQECRECTDWAVKRAQAFFPNDRVREEYEGYIRLGRVFMQDQGVPQDLAERPTADGAAPAAGHPTAW